jgi:hypothetical protein
MKYLRDILTHRTLRFYQKSSGLSAQGFGSPRRKEIILAAQIEDQRSEGYDPATTVALKIFPDDLYL